jgi:hypothetical protein
MKIGLRQGVHANVGELIQQKTWGKQTELTVTRLLLSSWPASSTAPATPPTSAAQEPEQIVQDLLRQVRYLLTLRGRPPLRRAGQEMFTYVQEVAHCLDQLLWHQPEPRLLQLRVGLWQAL